MNKQEFVDSFLEGVNLSGANKEELLKIMVGMVFDLRSSVKDHKEHIAYMDDIARGHEITMICRSCQQWHVPDCELSEISEEGNYCGRSERCCP